MGKPRNGARASLSSSLRAGLAPVLLTLAACTAPPTLQSGPQTLLLVSLEDGSIIRQDINLDADVCMKINAEPETTCFTRGEPILSADQLYVIGYRMERSEISLHAE